MSTTSGPTPDSQRARPTADISSGAQPVPGVKPVARPTGLRPAPLTFRISMTLFFVGGLALLVLLSMFASGVREFDWWLWVLIALAPVGLAVGAVSVGKAGRSLD